MHLTCFTNYNIKFLFDLEGIMAAASPRNLKPSI